MPAHSWIWPCHRMDCATPAQLYIHLLACTAMLHSYSRAHPLNPALAQRLANQILLAPLRNFLLTQEPLRRMLLHMLFKGFLIQCPGVCVCVCCVNGKPGVDRMPAAQAVPRLQATYVARPESASDWPALLQANCTASGPQHRALANRPVLLARPGRFWLLLQFPSFACSHAGPAGSRWCAGCS